jgi:hypothetical protein
MTAPSNLRCRIVRAPASGSTPARRPNRPRTGERLDPRPPTDLGEGALLAQQVEYGAFGAAQVRLGTRRPLDGHLRVLERCQELDELVAASQALGDQPTGGQREPHHVVRAHFAFPEQDVSRVVGEERADDLLDLHLDPVPELTGRQEAALDQDLSEVPGRPVGAPGLLELFGRDAPGAQQAVSQTIERLVRGGEYHFAPVEIDRLLVIAVFEVQEAGLIRGMEQMEDVRERKRADVGAEREIAVPGEGDGIPARDPLQEDGATSRIQHPNRFVGLEAEERALFG